MGDVVGNVVHAYLTVVGASTEVKRFARRAGKKPPGPLEWVPDIMVVGSDVIRVSRPRGRRDDIFNPDMWVGEGGELWADRMKDIGDGLSLKRYHFQIRNDDGRQHFRNVSRRYPSLSFVLADYWYSPDECRSFLLQNGRTREYEVPDDVRNAILAKSGHDPDLESDDDDDQELNYWNGWYGSWDVMDMVESRWLNVILRRHRRRSRR